MLDPNVEWWDREDDMDATVHRGHDGFSKRLAELDELAELHMEAKEFIDAGDYVAVSPLKKIPRWAHMDRRVGWPPRIAR